MFIQANASLDAVFKDLQQEIRRGTLDKKHPFRFITLATVNEGTPEARYVVLRKVDEFFNFYIYTDLRTSKVEAIQTNDQVSVLLYHPQKRIQVRVQATAAIHQHDLLAQDHWTRVQGDAQKAYNSVLAPGSSIATPEDAFTWNDPLSNPTFFGVIVLKPLKIEILQLNGLEHLRAFFTHEEGKWIGKWLVP